MLKARLSSRGQVALPKVVREQLGLTEGDQLTIRVEAGEVILRKSEGSWREWQARFRGSDLIKDLARERRQELTRDKKRP